MKNTRLFSLLPSIIALAPLPRPQQHARASAGTGAVPLLALLLGASACANRGTGAGDAGDRPEALASNVAAIDASPPPEVQADTASGDPWVPCIQQAQVSFTASPASLSVGQFTTLSWSVSYCPDLTVYLSPHPGNVQGLTGSVTIEPMESATYYLILSQTFVIDGTDGQYSYEAILPRASVQITVDHPIAARHRHTVRIDNTSTLDDFARGISTPNTTVLLADDVDLDVSALNGQHIAAGVHILGGRSPTKLGPRLYTSSSPRQLFVIDVGDLADGVRISGIRLDGGLPPGSISDAQPTSDGITVYSCVDVEIGNSEIYGWSGIGVSVQDKDENISHRLDLANVTAVWVHDNYIHHNRHWRAEGYGVQSAHGAYAVIERNVFDYNRHAIEASGDPGTGYLAYNNLVLMGGGENLDYYLGTQYTHEFDVHGTQEDWLHRGYYAGPAGEYFDYRYNTLLYVSGDALKVRGYPALGANVAHNIFLHEQDGAITQTDGDNLYAWANSFDQWPYDNIGGTLIVADFDGDGTPDNFIASGASWWFLSGVTHQWHVLRSSTDVPPAILEVADYNGDGRADVKVANGSAAPIIYSGGGPKLLPADPALWRSWDNVPVEAKAQGSMLVWQNPSTDLHVWRLGYGGGVTSAASLPRSAGTNLTEVLGAMPVT